MITGRVIGLAAALLLTALSLFPASKGIAQTYPQRIVSLGPINTENVYLLGAEDRLVADTSYCSRPEAAQLKPKIGTLMQVSLEKILSHHPDLVLATGLTQQHTVQKLRGLGLRVVQFSQPSSFKEICEQFLRLGELLGLEEKATAIIDQAGKRVETIEKKHAVFPRQKVFLQVGSRPLFSSVRNSFTNDFILYSGAVNIAGERKNGHLSYEQVMAMDPDVIIIAIMGSEAGVAAVEKKKWLKLSGIEAVENDRVHIIDPDLVCSPSPVTFAEALEKVAELIHPHNG